MCSGGDGFDSCRELRYFLCPTLVSCWKIFTFYDNKWKPANGQSPILTSRLVNNPYLLARDFSPTDPLPQFEPVGCFKDKISDRALPVNYASFLLFIDCRNMNATIRQCALVARDIGYQYFSVQYHGECWSSFDAALTYDKHGVQTNPNKCWANVGAGSTNYVYRFRQVSRITITWSTLSKSKSLI